MTNTNHWPATKRRKAKAAMLERQNHRCCSCGVRMDGCGWDATTPTFEHVLPFRYGGRMCSSNLVLTCRRCNVRGSAWRTWKKFCREAALGIDWHITPNNA